MKTYTYNYGSNNGQNNNWIAYRQGQNWVINAEGVEEQLHYLVSTRKDVQAYVECQAKDREINVSLVFAK